MTEKRVDLDMPEVAQVEFVGKEFKRRIGGKKGPKQPRRVRIVGSFDETTGDTRFRPASESPTTVSDLPHLPLAKAAEMEELASTSPTSSATRRKGASTPGYDVEAQYLLRGATGERIPRTGGFASKSEERITQKLRKKKGRKV